MVYKKSLSNKVFDVFNVSLLIFICLSCITPLLHVLFASISDPILLTAHTGIILRPLGFTFEGYKIIFRNNTIITAYSNTIFYLTIGTTISTCLTILGGYGLSRKNLLWGNTIMLFITITMFFSGGIIPFYLVVKSLGLTNTRWAIIIPSAISVFNLIIMRTAFRGIPDSLEESAKIDGAGHLTIMMKIIVPLAKSTIAVIVLFYAVNMWNGWFHASIFLNRRNLFPLQLILREILLSGDTTSVMNSGADLHSLADNYKDLIKYCTIIVATVPVLCFYPYIQKYFVTGVMIGSVKG